MPPKENKKTKALELAISQVDRQFGKGAIMRMGADQPVMLDNSISTGCLSLDVALGVGGIPRGRVIEIFGPESSGKTTLADEEIEELSSQLSSILDWVEELNEVNTENIEPLNNVSMATLPLRKDKENLQDQSKDILSNAPEKLENYFAVPKVVE